MSKAKEEYYNALDVLISAKSDNYVQELESQNKLMQECMIYDFKANVKKFGLETAKKLNSCYVIEQVTGLPIEEAMKKYGNPDQD